MDRTLATAVAAELRAFVAEAGTRRALPTTCHVGHPGRDVVRLQEPESTRRLGVADRGLRADLVERAVDGLRETTGTCVWLTRGGELILGDDDAAWYAAARQGLARHGLTLPAFFVLNRRGWVDLVSGEERRWRRVRSRAAR